MLPVHDKVRYQVPRYVVRCGTGLVRSRTPAPVADPAEAPTQNRSRGVRKPNPVVKISSRPLRCRLVWVAQFAVRRGAFEFDSRPSERTARQGSGGKEANKAHAACRTVVTSMSGGVSLILDDGVTRLPDLLPGQQVVPCICWMYVLGHLSILTSSSGNGFHGCAPNPIQYERHPIPPLPDCAWQEASYQPCPRRGRVCCQVGSDLIRSLSLSPPPSVIGCPGVTASHSLSGLPLPLWRQRAVQD